MSSLTRVVESIVGRLKSDPAYQITTPYTDRQLATVLWHRGRQIVRAIPLRFRARGVRGTVFRGRRVIVEHAYAFSSGPGLILEDGAVVNALSKHGIALGRNVTIARGATLTCTGVLAELGDGITIGDYSAVGAGSFLGGQGGIRVGRDVIMGPGVRIFSENHNHSDVERAIRTQGQTRAAVTIDDDCWIGGGVTILAGVTIGRGSVIAAGAVVTRDVPQYSVAAGIPARVLKSRLMESESALDSAAARALESLASWPRGEHALRGDP